MKLRHSKIFIFITVFFFLCVVPAMAMKNEEKYLWTEMENAERLMDGSLNLKLNLYYGIFPHEKSSAAEIDNLEAFYIRKGFRKSSRSECFKADIKILKNGCFLNIKSPDENSYTLYVSGMTGNGAERCYLYAKVTFALFGKSSNKNYNDLPVDAEEISRQFEIMTVPEFHYWPQTGSPIKISALFDSASSSITDIYVYDEHNSVENIKPGSNGEINYIPPDDIELNRISSTAFKHTIFTAVHCEADKKFISSRTFILHRSRYGNYRLKMGVIIFGITIVSFLTYMFFIRKRSAF